MNGVRGKGSRERGRGKGSMVKKVEGEVVEQWWRVGKGVVPCRSEGRGWMTRPDT